MRKAQYFNGIKFLLRVDGYYEAKINKYKVLMHRYVWEYYNGQIPDGYVVHHKDENRANNDISNLQCLSKSEHSEHHGTHKSESRKEKDRKNLDKARLKANEWHKSEEGRAWHREHAKRELEKGTLNPTTLYVCENCGKEFVGVKRRAKHKFCSGVCEQYFRRHNGLNNEVRVCAICGKEFTTDKYGKTKTCSRSCGMKLAHLENIGNWRSSKYKSKK